MKLCRRRPFEGFPGNDVMDAGVHGVVDEIDVVTYKEPISIEKKQLHSKVITKIAARYRKIWLTVVWAMKVFN